MKKTVKIGIDKLPNKMTKKGAIRYGNKMMPKDLKRVGFETTIFESDPEIHGDDFYRINYRKTS